MIDRGDTPTAFSSSEEVVRAICDIAQTHAGAFAAVGVSAPGLIFEEDPDGTIYHGGALTYICLLYTSVALKVAKTAGVDLDGRHAGIFAR